MKAMLSFLILFFVTIIACGGPSVSEEGDEAETLPVAMGEKLYNVHCVICHGKDGTLGLNEAGDLTASEMTLSERKGIISEGRGSMIAYRRILTRAEIDAVARYTKVLSGKGDSSEGEEMESDTLEFQ